MKVFWAVVVASARGVLGLYRGPRRGCAGRHRRRHDDRRGRGADAGRGARRRGRGRAGGRRRGHQRRRRRNGGRRGQHRRRGNGGARRGRQRGRGGSGGGGARERAAARNGWRRAAGAAGSSSGAWAPLSVMTVVNPKDHGAIGDGVTDDLAALGAAVNALPAAGGIVYLPEGAILQEDEPPGGDQGAREVLGAQSPGRAVPERRRTAAAPGDLVPEQRGLRVLRARPAIRRGGALRRPRGQPDRRRSRVAGRGRGLRHPQLGGRRRVPLRLHRELRGGQLRPPHLGRSDPSHQRRPAVVGLEQLHLERHGQQGRRRRRLRDLRPDQHAVRGHGVVAQHDPRHRLGTGLRGHRRRRHPHPPQLGDRRRRRRADRRVRARLRQRQQRTHRPGQQLGLPKRPHHRPSRAS